MTVEEFEVVYQVTKDLHSVPEERLVRIGLGLDDALRLRQAARSIRVRLDEAPAVCIWLGEGVSPEVAAKTVTVTEGATSVREIQGMVPASLAGRWHALVEAVIASLGPRELYLRTGYDEKEVREAAQRLVIDP
ncbi:hypothetical protein AB0I91_02160 [Actinosynnema sp. NPDC049800]